MRIIVMSDSHRNLAAVIDLVEKHRTADIFIHLGDGAAEFEEVKSMFPEIKFLCVRGNCDLGTDLEIAGCFHCGQAKIFYTHGHMYNVKYSIEGLVRAGWQMHANIVLYGHTHIPFVEYRDGMHIMNPGSLGMPRGMSTGSYGIIDIADSGIVCYNQQL